MDEQILKMPEAGQKVIDSYLKMPIGNKIITCPYYTNLKKERAALRVLLGKGSAQEIINETKFIAQKEDVDLGKFSAEEIYRFMVEHNLGIDCSGLVVYILKAVYQETKKVNILRKIKIVSFLRKPWRYIISLLRPVENISVRVLAHNKNSFLIESFSDLLPGDMLVRANLRHVYLVTKVEKENGVVKKITFIHAPRPKQKDYFGPGVVQSAIALEKGTLEELNEKIEDNVVIRRIKILSS